MSNGRVHDLRVGSLQSLGIAALEAMPKSPTTATAVEMNMMTNVNLETLRGGFMDLIFENDVRTKLTEVEIL
jgi:hypothetical protein